MRHLASELSRGTNINEWTAFAALGQCLIVKRSYLIVATFFAWAIVSVNNMRNGPCQDVRVISLGSRRTLCVHPTVRRLSEARLNDACLDLIRVGGGRLMAYTWPTRTFD